MPDPIPPTATTTTTTTETPPITTTTATDTAPGQQPGGNDENKFRRLHEAAEAKRVAAETRVAELEAAEQRRKDAQLSEVEREKKRADDAEAEAKSLKHEKLKNEVAGKHNLTAEARELLEGADEAELEAKAAKLAAIMKQPIVEGTVTQPGGAQTASLAEQITAAENSGNAFLAIQLKRQQAGFTS